MSRLRLAIYRHVLLSRTDRFIARQTDSFVDSDICMFGIARSSDIALGPTHWILSDHTQSTALAMRSYQISRRSRRLAKAISDWAPTLILAHYAHDGWRIAPTARTLGLPLVVTCHGSDVLCRDEFASQMSWSARQLRRNWHRLIEVVDLFLPVSDFVGRALEQRGVPPSKILVHYLGIPIPPPHREVRRSPKKQFLFVGRLEKNKGCADLLTAFRNLKYTTPNVRLKIVGDGGERPYLESQAQSFGLSGDDVDFTGYLSPSGVARALDESIAICIPSMKTRSGVSEGLGLVALEAQVREVPVIAYRTGGLPEAVQDGTGGVLVPAGDTASLSDAMNALLRDPDRCSRMGRQGREFVSQRFDARKQTHALERYLLQRYVTAHPRGVRS